MIGQAEIRNSYPHLNDRARGWLQYLHRKATTPDDWSEDGEPHPWWDRTSTDPMCSFPRFDLQESTYALAMMADKTPAWREVYAQILDEICQRFLTYWAAVDWLSQFGPDPRRKEYPPEWKGALIPERFWGEYDAPGWVANGIEPWGMQPDPIGADGNLFFKGWLNLTQALHAYVTGEDKWGQPFLVAGVDRARFPWTQHQLVEHLAHQWTSTPMGPHCENTKVWPFCLTAAGLGLQLYDAVFQRQSHQCYQEWLEHTKGSYYGVDKAGRLQWVAMYYDPLKEHVHSLPPPLGLAIAFYALPQAPEFAEFLYRAAVSFLQWDNPAAPLVATPDPRTMALGLALARELGDYATEARLRAHAEVHFEPKSFGEGGEQFGYWFGLGEPWPRGQLSALALCADVAEPGSWRRLFREPNLTKYEAPTVAGVDYPALGVAQAWNDPKAGALQLQVHDGNGSKSGAGTSFRVCNLPDTGKVAVLCDGQITDHWRVSGEGEITLQTTVAAHHFQIFTGYRPPKEGAQAERRPVRPKRHRPSNAVARSGGGSMARLVLSNPAACPCCAGA